MPRDGGRNTEVCAQHLSLAGLGPTVLSDDFHSLSGMVVVRGGG